MDVFNIQMLWRQTHSSPITAIQQIISQQSWKNAILDITGEVKNRTYYRRMMKGIHKKSRQLWVLRSTIWAIHDLSVKLHKNF